MKDREIARLRFELRRSVAQARQAVADELLASLRRFAEEDRDTACPELARECVRWQERIRLLAS